MPSWVAPLFEQIWSFIAVAMAVHALGRVSKHVATRLGWRRYKRSDVAKLVETARGGVAGESSGDVVLPEDASWYDVTLRVHPLVSGALAGLLPLPTLNVIDALGAAESGTSSLVAARCAWFMLAGALSGQIYEAVKFAFTEGRTRILALIGLGKRASKPPAPPDDVSSGNEDR